MRGDDGRAPGVEQQEAAGPVRVLGGAGRVAGLAEERGLLIAGDPGDRDAARQPAEIHGLAHHARGRDDRRQDGPWNAQK